MLRSKTKILHDEVSEPPIWGFDGSSTNQATGDKSDCVLRPVFECHDPIRGGRNILVMCDVLLASNMSPHATNTRAAAASHREEVRRARDVVRSRAGVHDAPSRRHPTRIPGGWRRTRPAGPLLLRRRHAVASWAARSSSGTPRPASTPGLSISGTNPEVMPGQWEFQIGPLGPTAVGDELNVARWLLSRIAEDYDVIISLDAKPGQGRLERRRLPHQLLQRRHARRLRQQSSRPSRRSATTTSSSSRTTDTASRNA